MVNLEELESEFFKLNHRIAGKKGFVTRLKKLSEESSKASKERETEEAILKLYEEIRNKYKEGSKEWDDANKDVEKAQKKVEEKIENERIAKEKSNNSNLERAEKELKDLQDEYNALLMRLQKNPDFNDELVNALEEEFDKKITKKDRELSRVNQKEKKLANNFNSDKKYGPLVNKLKSVYEEIEKYDLFSTDEKLLQARKRYIELVDTLRKKVNEDKGFESLVLTDKDIQSICSGEFKIEQYEKDRSNILAEKEKIKSDKQDTIQRISDLKETTKSPELESVDKAIKENEDKIRHNEQKRRDFLKQKNGMKIPNLDQAISDEEEKLKNKSQEIDDIQSKIQELKDKKNNSGNSEKRLLELWQKIQVIQIEKPKLILNQEKYKDDLEALKDTGYITHVALQDLRDSNSELFKKYKEFFDADYKLRKAFETVKSDSSKEAKINLEAAINDYYKIGDELKTLSGYEIKDWQNYLRRNLEAKCKKNEEIDEVYYPETMINKYNNLGKSYKCTDNDYYKSVGDSLKKLSEYEKKVLDGEDIEIDNINEEIEKHHGNMNGLANDLKIDEKNLCGFLKDAIVEKGKKIWTAIKNLVGEKVLRKVKKPKFKSDVSKPENLSELKKNIEESRKACKESAEKLSNIELTPEEKKEYDELVKNRESQKDIDIKIQGLEEKLKKTIADKRRIEIDVGLYKKVKENEVILENEAIRLQEENKSLYREKESVLNKERITKKNDRDPKIKDTNPKLLNAVKRKTIEDDGR